MKQIDQQFIGELNRRYATASLAVIVFIAITVALTVAAALLAGKVQPFGAPTGEGSFSIDNLTNPNAVGSTLATFLWITVLALAISAFLLRRIVFAPATLRDAATIKGVSGLLQSLQTKTILLAALGLIVAILGFVIALASGSWFDCLRAAAIAAIVFLINYPRKNAWQRVAAAAVK